MSSSSYSSSEDEADSPRHSSDQKKEDRQPPANAFKNDGSFLEMFKKMQEQQSNSIPSQSQPEAIKDVPKDDLKSNSSQKPPKFVGKRRLGRVLPTGLVKKPKKEDSHNDSSSSKDEKSGTKSDPWSNYMAEVKRYKQQSCSEEEGSRRPLVK